MPSLFEAIDGAGDRSAAETNFDPDDIHRRTEFVQQVFHYCEVCESQSEDVTDGQSRR
jgi:hypothetical protein